MHLNGENWLNGIKWGGLAGNRKMDRILVPKWLSASLDWVDELVYVKY